MPRTAITLIRKHGSQTWELVSGPEVRIDHQFAALTDGFCHSPHHADVAEVQVWDSDTGIRRRRMLSLPPSPEAHPTPSAATAPAPQPTGLAADGAGPAPTEPADLAPQAPSSSKPEKAAKKK